MAQGARLNNSVPASYVRLFREAVARRGLDADAVLHGTELTAEQLERPDFRLRARDAARAIRNAIELTGDPGLGLEIGLRTRPTGHGDLGFAAMSCGTLGEAIELVARYLTLQLPDIALRAFQDGSQVVLESSERHRMSPFLRRLILESLVSGLYQMGTSLLLDYAVSDAEIWFDWPEPDYFARYRESLPRTSFEMPSVQLRFSVGYRDQQLRLADATAVRRSVEQCEREMKILDPGAADVVERVRRTLVPGRDGFPTADAVAARLAMSGRTLKRRLKESGYGFRTLLDEARYREARRLLKDPQLDIQQIAAWLGYSDPACFTRAFRRWSGGHPPSAVRSRLSAPDAAATASR